MQEIRVELDARSFRDLLGKSSSFDRRQKAHLRKRMRAAAGDAVAAVKAEARKTPVTRSANPTSRGTRARIASSTRLQILAGNTRAGATIVTRAPLARAWEARRGWRHPVYGDRDTWRQQVGRPGYFAGAIFARRNATRRAVEQAMQDTLREMGR